MVKIDNILIDQVLRRQNAIAFLVVIYLNDVKCSDPMRTLDLYLKIII
jgi:hypothetical protein